MEKDIKKAFQNYTNRKTVFNVITAETINNDTILLRKSKDITSEKEAVQVANVSRYFNGTFNTLIIERGI